MIYLYAIFFACGSLHLVRFLWVNYVTLILGSDVMSAVLANGAASAILSGSYLLFALLAALFAAVPAAKVRDSSLAAINGAVFGMALGTVFAGVMWFRGDISFAIEFAEIALFPVGLALMVTMAGYFGGLLSRLGGVVAEDDEAAVSAYLADNDNAPAASHKPAHSRTPKAVA